MSPSKTPPDQPERRTVWIMADFDVDQWWAGLTDQERELAQRHRDDDPLHPEVVKQLHRVNEPIMWGEPTSDGRSVERWHWMPEVRDFLTGGCE